MRLLTTVCAALALCASLGLAQTTSTSAGQAYPAKPVRLIVAFAPGGAADVLGRIIAAQLTHQLGQQIVVDNRAGAGGTTGTEIASRAKPDGYTLMLFSSAHAIGPSLSKVAYDPVGAKALASAFSTAEAKKMLLDQGAEPGLMGPGEFGPFYLAELAKWGRVIREAKIKAE